MGKWSTILGYEKRGDGIMKKKITNVTVYSIKKEPFKGEVVVEDGIISEVAKQVKTSCEEIIDGKNGLLFPGFIDAHSHIGLSPEGYGFEYDDVNEMTNPVTPEVRTEDAFVPTDAALRESALGGVMIHCVLTGSGNPVGGLGFIAKYTLSNRTTDKVVRRDIGLKMATGENPKRVYAEKKLMPVTRMGTAAVIRKYLQDGLNYIQKKEKTLKEGKPFCEVDIKFETAEKVLKRAIPVRIHCHRAEDMLTALRIKKEFGIDMVIEHATEYLKIREEIKAAGVPVILGPFMSTRVKVELRDLTYKTYKAALEDGVLMACMSDHPVFPSQVLRLQAGMAVAYGASEEGMLRSLTIMPAQILKIDEEYGSIEKGKRACLCIWNGHPFDSRSHVVWNDQEGWTTL
jgi:imidazolonepropionase-like amidohydrolase